MKNFKSILKSAAQRLRFGERPRGDAGVAVKLSVLAAAALLPFSGAYAENTVRAINGDEFKTPPAVATGADIKGCKSAKLFAHYLATNQQLRFPELFADDSVWLTPAPTVVLHGKKEVSEFIPRIMASVGEIEEVPVSVLGSGKECFVELAVRMPGKPNFTLVASHHLTLDDKGQIVRLISYIRPAVAAQHAQLPVPTK